MTVPPEIAPYIVALIIAIIGAVVAIFKFLPDHLDRRWTIKQQEQSQRLEAQRKKLDEALAQSAADLAARQKRDDKLFELIDSLIARDKASNEREKTSAAQLETMVKALTTEVEISRGMQLELRANTTITKEGVQTIGELSDNVEALLETGSKPVQKINEGMNALRIEVAAITISQKDSERKLDSLVSEVTGLKNSVEIMLSVAKAKLDDVRKGTGEHSTISLAPSSSP